MSDPTPNSASANDPTDHTDATGLQAQSGDPAPAPSASAAQPSADGATPPPGYAQPGYGATPPPGYAQPGYGATPPPGYAQPGYPPPGYAQPGYGATPPPGTVYTPAPPGWTPKSKLAAGLLGIFLGGWGVHNFYIGNTQRGVIQIVVTIVTLGIGSIWGFVEGILILVAQPGTKWAFDAHGWPLTQ